MFKTSDRPQGKKQFALVRNMTTQGTLVIRLLMLLYSTLMKMFVSESERENIGIAQTDESHRM